MAKKVLVIEDDVEINELIGEYLSLEEMTYLSAFTGKAGLDMVAREKPDAIVLDLMLPDMNGYQVCEQLSTQRATANIPVIMLTCCNQPEDQLKGLESGALRYMNKPFLPDELINNLRSAFQWKSQLTQRPPRGQIEVTAGQWPHMMHCMNEMFVDLFYRTGLPDVAVNAIRDGFHAFGHIIMNWAEANKRDPHMVIEYRLTAGSWDELALGREPQAIEWLVSELEPGLLAESIVNAQSVSTSWNTVKNNEKFESDMLGAWYQFLAQCGVDRFEKNTRMNYVRLSRTLRKSADESMPMVTMDGARMPTRLLAEAKTADR